MGGHGFSPHLAATTVWVWSPCPQPERAEDASEHQREGCHLLLFFCMWLCHPGGAKRTGRQQEPGLRLFISHSSCWG